VFVQLGYDLLQVTELSHHGHLFALDARHPKEKTKKQQNEVIKEIRQSPSTSQWSVRLSAVGLIWEGEAVVYQVGMHNPAGTYHDGLETGHEQTESTALLNQGGTKGLLLCFL
jgi:hypothetical protein